MLQGCLKNRIQLRAVIDKIDIQSQHWNFTCFKTNPNALHEEYCNFSDCNFLEKLLFRNAPKFVKNLFHFSDNSDSINMVLLRQQQLRLAIIKAIKLFFANQNVLRHILKQSAIHLEEDKKDVNLLQRFVYIYYQVVYLHFYQLFVYFFT